MRFQVSLPGAPSEGQRLPQALGRGGAAYKARGAAASNLPDRSGALAAEGGVETPAQRLPHQSLHSHGRRAVRVHASQVSGVPQVEEKARLPHRHYHALHCIVLSLLYVLQTRISI